MGSVNDDDMRAALRQMEIRAGLPDGHAARAVLICLERDKSKAVEDGLRWELRLAEINRRALENEGIR